MARTSAEKTCLGALDARNVSRLVAAASDVALVLDDKGTILEVLVHGDDPVTQRLHEWRGRSWLQTAADDSRQKVEALLRDAHAAAAAGTGVLPRLRARQVNHSFKGSEDLPLLYSVVPLAAEEARTPAKAQVVAFGRDLRNVMALQQRLVDTQQAMERDYWRFREAETRYRHLLETSTEAVLIVDGSTQKVLEANPAARALCGATRAKLVGGPLLTLFDGAHGERVQDLLASARSVGGKHEPLRVKLAAGSTEVNLSASVFRQDDAAFVLVRLHALAAEGSPAKGGRAAAGAPRSAAGGSASDATLAAFVQNTPDGLVFCDAAGKIMSANRAFLALATLGSEDQARGQPLDRWLGRTGVELGVLMANLRQRGSVGRFVTALRGEYGSEIEVEISAAQLSPGDSTVLAFAIRDIERRLRPEAQSPTAMTRSVTELAELVGRTPLKDIVAETTDLIEQLCIETALEMSHDNRASAALLLGLSRQSLYVKLRRYGLGSLGSDE
jgi:transcriptional regulator PpsR